MSYADVEPGLYSALTTGAGTVVANLVGGTAAPRIYDTQAPQGVAMPFVIFQYLGGGEENISPNRHFEVTYRVELVAADRITANTGAAAIDAALHDRVLTIAGYTNWMTTRRGWFALTDNEQGKQYWRRGAFYNVRAAK